MKSMLFISGWGFNQEVFAPLAAHFSETRPCELLNGNTLVESGALNDHLAGYDQPPIVIAWSLGGLLAIEAALHGPDQVAALVLMSTTLKFCSDEAYLWGIPPAELRAMKIGMRKNPDLTLRDFAAVLCEPQTVGILPSEVLHEGPEQLARGLDYLLETDLRARDFSAMPPSLVYHGKKDEIISSNAGRLVSEKLNSANLMRYNGIGHALPLVQTRIVAANIQFHLEQLGV